MTSFLYPALAHSNLAFGSLAKAAMAFFFMLHWCPLSHCAGVNASVKLSLLPELPTANWASDCAWRSMVMSLAPTCGFFKLARRRSVDGSVLGKDLHGCTVGCVHGASQCITCLRVLIRVPRVVALPPNAMGTNSLFFVLAFLGRQKIGSTSALSGFPLKIFLRGRTSIP